MAGTILEIVKTGLLPETADEILPLLTNEDGTFLSQEGTLWDFKESWPFSYSDSYFGGICRLICAFANTEGGLIVFGVDDKTRRGGRTKIKPNLDKLELAFRQWPVTCMGAAVRHLALNPIKQLIFSPNP